MIVEPKFKFGQWVRTENTIFKIDQIKLYPSGFSYTNADIDGYFDEEKLSIYYPEGESDHDDRNECET